MMYVTCSIVDVQVYPSCLIRKTESGCVGWLCTRRDHSLHSQMKLPAAHHTTIDGDTSAHAAWLVCPAMTIHADDNNQSHPETTTI